MMVVFSLPLSLSVALGAEPTKDSLEVVRKNVEQGKAVLVDVREKSEWEEGHIKGAVFLPLSELRKGIDKQEIKKKLPAKKIVYTYCVLGKRAGTAGEILQEAGYEVRPLKPGYRELLEAGFEDAEK